MTSSKPAGTGPAESAADASLREALAAMEAAQTRHAAIVTAMSRSSVSPAERRLAQSESKKVEHEMREAKRVLEEAQAQMRTSGTRS